MKTNGTAAICTVAPIFEDASGNVGIATVAPVEKMTIANTSPEGLGIYRDQDVTSIGAAGTVVNLGARNGSTFTPGAQISGVLNNPSTTGTLVFYTRTANALSEKMRIAGTGNVGIGTNASLFPLQITRYTGSSGNLLLEGDGLTTGIPRLFFVDDNGAAVTASPAWQLSNTADLFQIQRSATLGGGSSPFVTIKNTGNVGIGLINPTEELTVEDDTDGSATVMQLTSSDAGFASNQELRVDFQQAAITTARQAMSFFGASDWGFNFYTFNSSLNTTPNLTLRGNGSVGIGTTTPFSLLNIYGAANRIKLSNATGGNTSGDGFQIGSVNDNSVDIELWNWETGFMRFGTSNSEKMRILSSGNVGIGTSAPLYKFDVVTTGTSAFRLVTKSSTVATPQIDMYDSIRAVETVVSSFDGTTAGTYIASYSNHPLMFGSYASSGPTSKMVLLANGFVGIGLTNPGYQLSVTNTTAGEQRNLLQLVGSQTGRNPRLNITSQNTQTGTKYIQIITDADDGVFPNLIFNPTGGNVGIGTTTADDLLDVYGNIGVNNSGIIEFHTSTTNNQRGYIQAVEAATNNGAGGNPGLIMATSGNETIAFKDGGLAGDVNMVIIGSTGNVGIGTSAPAEKLEVCGNLRVIGAINASGLINGSVGISCTSDFRFKQNITPLPSALKNVMQLQGVNYFWKTNEFPEKQFTNTKQIGFIAQDLEKIYPEMVFTDEKGYKSVDYSRLTPVLVEAIKELNSKNEQQQKLIQNQQKMIETLNVHNKNTESNFKVSELKIQKLEAAVEKLMEATIKEEAKK